MTVVNDIIAEITQSLDALVEESDAEELILGSKSVTQLEKTLGIDLSPLALEREIEKFQSLKANVESFTYNDYQVMINAIYNKVDYFTNSVSKPLDYLFLIRALIDISKNAAAFVIANEADDNKEDYINEINENYTERLKTILIKMEDCLAVTNDAEEAMILSKATNSALQTNLESGNYNRIMNVMDELNRSINALSLRVIEGDNNVTLNLTNSIIHLQNQIDYLKGLH